MPGCCGSSGPRAPGDGRILEARKETVQDTSFDRYDSMISNMDRHRDRMICWRFLDCNDMPIYHFISLMNISIYMYLYIYTYICINMCIYTYVYLTTVQRYVSCHHWLFCLKGAAKCIATAEETVHKAGGMFHPEGIKVGVTHFFPSPTKTENMRQLVCFGHWLPSATSYG